MTKPPDSGGSEEERAPEPAETELELYSALGSGTKGVILYRPCDDLHGHICTVGTGSGCHGIMDNRTLWQHARELNVVASQALQVLSFAVPVPNASRSNVSDSMLRNDAFCVRVAAMAVVLFNRNFRRATGGTAILHCRWLAQAFHRLHS